MSDRHDDCSTLESVFRQFSLARNGADCCYWMGVACEGGRVTRLQLENSRLSGSIPADISRLEGLTSLNLSQNQLRGSIPPELGRLANLRELRLWGNKLSGSIPRELGNLSKLEKIGLGTNELNGTIPVELGNLGNLLELWLENNELTGAIPGELANLTKLQGLYLANNNFSGPISRLPSPSNACQIVQSGANVTALCLSPSFSKSGSCWNHLATLSIPSCPSVRDPPMPTGTASGNVPPTVPRSPNSPGGFSMSAIVGVGASAAVFVVLVVLLVFVKKQKKTRKAHNHGSHTSDSSSSGQDMCAPIVFSPAPGPDHLAYPGAAGSTRFIPTPVYPPIPTHPGHLPGGHAAAVNRESVAPPHQTALCPAAPYAAVPYPLQDMFLLPPATIKTEMSHDESRRVVIVPQAVPGQSKKPDDDDVIYIA